MASMARIWHSVARLRPFLSDKRLCLHSNFRSYTAQSMFMRYRVKARDQIASVQRTMHSKTDLDRITHQSKRDPSLRVRIVPMFTDNYGYIVIDEANQVMFTVDPAEPAKILPALAEEERNNNRKFLGTLTTHKHIDHCGGNRELSLLYPQLLIAGPRTEDIPACNYPVQGGQNFSIGRIKIRVLDVPCHTRGHVAYVITGDPETPPLLFSGDVLFVGGCGRFFEGTAEDMYHSLYEVLLKLPKETRCYCGHEYTLSNLRFALSVDPRNAALREKLNAVKVRRAKKLPSVPSTLREEMLYNPFLRVHCESIKSAVGGSDPMTVLENLRRRKDTFEG